MAYLGVEYWRFLQKGCWYFTDCDFVKAWVNNQNIRNILHFSDTSNLLDVSFDIDVRLSRSNELTNTQPILLGGAYALISERDANLVALDLLDGGATEWTLQTRMAHSATPIVVNDDEAGQWVIYDLSQAGILRQFLVDYTNPSVATLSYAANCVGFINAMSVGNNNNNNLVEYTNVVSPQRWPICCLVLWQSSGVCNTRWFRYCDTSECRWDLDSLEQSFRHPHGSAVPDVVLECTSDCSAVQFTDCFTIRFTHYDGTHSQRSDPCSGFHHAKHRSIGSAPLRTFHEQQTLCPHTGSLCNQLSIYCGAHMPKRPQNNQMSNCAWIVSQLFTQSRKQNNYNNNFHIV